MVQIIGTKKCRETAKAIRYCKECSIPYQFVDLAERTLSDGEWKSIFQGCEHSALIDERSQYFKNEGYSFREYDVEEELMEHPQLLKTPVLRSKGRVHMGFDTDLLIQWGKN